MRGYGNCSREKIIEWCNYFSILYSHAWWRHPMETLPALLGPLWGESTGSPVNSPHKGQCRGALMFSLICAWMNDWVNTREAGDLRRHRAHYDVTIMCDNIYAGCRYKHPPYCMLIWEFSKHEPMCACQCKHCLKMNVNRDVIFSTTIDQMIYWFRVPWIFHDEHQLTAVRQ